MAQSSSNIHISAEDEDLINSLGYTFGESLGSGTFGSVIKCTYTEPTKESIELACKVLYMEKYTTVDRWKLAKNIKAEKESLYAAVHENVVRLHNLIEIIDTKVMEPKHVFLFMELGSGTFKDLLPNIVQPPLTEDAAKDYFSQITIGIGYLHSIGIAHRDLKPVNCLLFKDKSFPNNYCIKITDFGMAHIFRANQHPNVRDIRGTVLYMPPEEIADLPHDPRLADIWSLGVMLAQMIIGYSQTIHIRTGSLQSFPMLICREQMSDEARDLLEKILRIDPQRRYSIDMILQHPWFPKVLVVESWMPFYRKNKKDSFAGFSLEKSAEREKLEIVEQHF